MRTVKFTKEGYQKVKDEYDDLVHKRVGAVQELSKARELGDLSENGYYKGARARLSQIDGRLRSLSSLMDAGVIVSRGNAEEIGIGSIVTISDGNKTITYAIVGDVEADPTKGRISLLSPIGKSLAGKKVHDSVAIKIPAGELHYQIVSITI